MNGESQLFETFRIGEDSDWEFKSAKGGLPLSLWETYSTMANTDGGVIVLGVQQNDAECVVSGIPDPDEFRKAFWDTISNRGKVSANLLTDLDVELREAAGRTVMIVRVPRAKRRERPVYVGQNPLAGTYRRNYEGDYHCTPDEVGRMLADRAEEPADSRILEHFSIEDLDPDSLKQYRQRFSARDPDHPWLSLDIGEFLEKLGAWREERSTGRSGITAAGLLMFGTAEAIRDPEAVPSFHLDYREKTSSDPAVRWTDRLTIDGKWAGNVFQFYLQVIQRLARDLRIPFQLDPDLFRKDDTVVHEAIREAVVNALVHADYRGQGGIVIEKYPDRLELSNPGTLLISRKQLLRGGISECRNKTLQTMFQMIGGGEKAGSGIDKIWRGWNSQHWRSPGIHEEVQPDRVCLILPMLSMIPEQSLKRLQGQFAARFGQLSEEEVQALVTADIEKVVTNARMQEITSTHPADLTRILKSLADRGFLVPEGRVRWTRYRLPSSVGGDSVQSAVDSVQSQPSSTQRAVLESIPAVSCDAARAYAAKPWHSSAETRRVIVEVCQEIFLTAADLGRLLARNPDAIRGRFLRPMVKQGLLELKYPESPNRPDQAYRSASRVPDRA